MKTYETIAVTPIENRPGLSLVTAEMIDTARTLVCNSGRVSISYVQRNMRIGYNQAARIKDGGVFAGMTPDNVEITGRASGPG